MVMFKSGMLHHSVVSAVQFALADRAEVIHFTLLFDQL